MGPHSNDEKLWRFPEGVDLSHHEKRKVVAEVVAIGVRTMFAMHVYSFGGRVFHQKVGGPIGLRSTGAIARVVMAMTDRMVKYKMVKDGIDTKLDARYVDDGRTLLHCTPSRLGGRCFEIHLDKQDSEGAQGHCEFQQQDAAVHIREMQELGGWEAPHS